jgi:hypothetical protein
MLGSSFKDMRSVGMTNVKFMGPDDILEQALIDAAGVDAESVYATFNTLPPLALIGKVRSGTVLTKRNTTQNETVRTEYST